MAVAGSVHAMVLKVLLVAWCAWMFGFPDFEVYVARVFPGFVYDI